MGPYPAIFRLYGVTVRSHVRERERGQWLIKNLVSFNGLKVILWCDREARVRELVHVLLRLIAVELGLQRVTWDLINKNELVHVLWRLITSNWDCSVLQENWLTEFLQLDTLYAYPNSCRETTWINPPPHPGVCFIVSYLECSACFTWHAVRAICIISNIMFVSLFLFVFFIKNKSSFNILFIWCKNHGSSHGHR